MKKKIYFLMCFLLIICFVGCNKNITDNDPQNAEKKEISPLAEEGLNQNILNFFNEEMPNIRTKRSKGFFTTIAEDKDTCLIINSDKDFHNAYKGNHALPTIDFQYCTLVLGKLYLDASYLLEGQFMTMMDAEFQLILSFKREDAVAVMLPLYYWGIYPKFYSENVSIKKVIK